MDLAAAAQKATAQAPAVASPQGLGEPAGAAGADKINSFADVKNAVIGQQNIDTDDDGQDQSRDVREAERVEDYGDDDTIDLAGESAAETTPVAAATPGTQQAAAVAAALQIGEHNLTSEQAQRLAAILKEAGGFDLVDATWTDRMNHFRSIKSAFQKHYDESNAIRKQAMRQISEARALKETVDKLIQTGQLPQLQARQGQQQQAPEAAALDPNDPFTPMVAPLHQKINALTQAVEKLTSHRDPYTQHMIERGFDQLQQNLGPSFNRYLGAVADKLNMQIPVDPYTGQPDFSRLDHSQSLMLQNGVVDYKQSVDKHKENFGNWFDAAVSKTTYLPKSYLGQDWIWAQIETLSANKQPVDQNTFNRLALEAERSLKAGNDAVGAQQAATRQDAGQPLVPHGGSGLPPAGKGDVIKFEGTKLNDLSQIRDHLIARSRLAGKPRR